MRHDSAPLTGKIAVLTGVSRGIGLALSQALAARGMHLIGIARDPAPLEGWAQDIMGRYGVRAVGLAADLGQDQAWAELSARILTAACCIQTAASPSADPNQPVSPIIHLLINNAGIEIYRAFADYDPAEIEAVIRVNLLAAMGLTQALLPHLAAGAQIVNMASLAAKKSHPYDSPYAASKAGLLVWSRSLRQELAARGIGVSAICPGYVVDQGMLADTGIGAPPLAGRSPAQRVITATLGAIAHNRAEVIVNQNPLFEGLTRVMLSAEQLVPALGDVSNQWLGITKLNRQRAKATARATPARSAFAKDSVSPDLEQLAPKQTAQAQLAQAQLSSGRPH